MRMILAAIALLMPPAELPASVLPPGSRVRVTMRSVGTSGDAAKAKPLTGTLAVLDGDRLTLVRADETIIVPVDRVLRLETLVRPSRKTKGAAIGASILGGAMLALFGSFCASDWGCEGADPFRVAAVVLVPAAIGAGVGASIAAGDRWKEIPVAGPRAIGSDRPRLDFRLTPDKRGVAAGVSLPLFRPARSRKR